MPSPGLTSYGTMLFLVPFVAYLREISSISVSIGLCERSFPRR